MATRRLKVAPATRSRKRGRSIRSKRVGWRRYGMLAGRIILCAWVVRLVALQGYRVPSRSMEDTLEAGEYLLVEKISYGARLPYVGWRVPGLRQPRSGDIVVFRAPGEPRRLYVKRCIAVAGQVVQVRDKVVYVDDQRIVDPPYSKYVDPRIVPAARSPRDNCGPMRVPPGGLFLIGDNRDRSRDSRHWGAVPTAAVVGRPLWIYWSCAAGEPSTNSGWGAPLRQLRSLLSRLRWERLGSRIR